jgi:hypothetical protein
MVSRILEAYFLKRVVHPCKVAGRTGDDHIAQIVSPTPSVRYHVIELHPHHLERSMLFEIGSTPGQGLRKQLV